jgi:hypothetical protein
VPEKRNSLAAKIKYGRVQWKKSALVQDSSHGGTQEV